MGARKLNFCVKFLRNCFSLSNFVLYERKFSNRRKYLAGWTNIASDNIHQAVYAESYNCFTTLTTFI